MLRAFDRPGGSNSIPAFGEESGCQVACGTGIAPHDRDDGGDLRPEDHHFSGSVYSHSLAGRSDNAAGAGDKDLSGAKNQVTVSGGVVGQITEKN